MALLSQDDIDRALAELPGWEHADAALRRRFEFASYLDGVLFANRVAGAAEAANHHPDMLVTYRAVTVTLTSHDSGGVTDRDAAMARRIDALFANA